MGFTETECQAGQSSDASNSLMSVHGPGFIYTPPICNKDNTNARVNIGEDLAARSINLVNCTKYYEGMKPLNGYWNA